MTIQPQPSPLALRVLRFPLTLLVGEFVLVAGVASAYSALVHRLIPPSHDWPNFVGAMGLVVLIIALWKGIQQGLEGRVDRELGFSRFGRELGAGLVIGFAIFVLIALTVAGLGGLTFRGVRGLGDISGMLVVGLVPGVFEEMLFRGIALRHLERLVGTWGALFITAAFFGGAHLFNRDATWFAAVAIAFEAGVLLGGAYLLTRRLWMVVGIHAAWNFTQGWVFSAPVSGGPAPAGLLIVDRHGPAWLTGGAFGLEASAVAMVIATLAGCLMTYLAWRRGEFVPPMWRRPAMVAKVL